MADLKAEMRKMSRTLLWPLRCPPKHKLMWFLGNKYLKGRGLLSISAGEDAHGRRVCVGVSLFGFGTQNWAVGVCKERLALCKKNKKRKKEKHTNKSPFHVLFLCRCKFACRSLKPTSTPIISAVTTKACFCQALIFLRDASQGCRRRSLRYERRTKAFLPRLSKEHFIDLKMNAQRTDEIAWVVCNEWLSIKANAHWQRPAGVACGYWSHGLRAA